MSDWPWQLASALSKLLVYGSFVSLTGALFVLCLGAGPCARKPPGSSPHILWSVAARRRISLLMLCSSGVGFLAMLLFFLLQVGQVNQNGVKGMLDPFMMQLLAQTPVGSGTFLRMAGFALIGLGVAGHWRRLRQEANPPLPGMILGIGMLGVLLCCMGFSMLGHVADLSLSARVLLALHVLVAGLWIGALYPLYTLCRTEPAAAVFPLMQRFGQWGWGITLTLVGAGVLLLSRLLVSPGELWTSSYGQLFSVKIALLLCLLGLAALNKFHLVPALQAAGAGRLQRSIRGEMLLAALILLLTALLSTVTGPVHLMN
ncbi:MAG: CopD family protein [Pseudomonadales bacterium]|nr:CopD family protein [Pseudomonadales bacterium]